MSVTYVRLGDVATLQAGIGFPLDIQGRNSGLLPFAKVGDISRCGRVGNSILSAADHYVEQADIEILRARPVPKGSILFAKIGEAIRQNHRVIAGCDMLIDNNAMAAIPNERIDGRFLYHFLKTVDFYSLAPATTVPALRKSDLERLSIPLPSLPEQRRIAAILDQADALRAMRREALEQLNSLTQSIFIEMFGVHEQTPVTVGEHLQKHSVGWSWELLTDVARLATGHTPDRKRQDYWNGHIPWITLSEIRRLDGLIADTTEEKITETGIANSSAVVLPAGTVCFSRTASVGFVTIMGRDMATSQDFVNWVCGPRLNPMYLMHALVLSRARLRALSTGSTHKTIYFPTVERFRALIPPIEKQEYFAQKIMTVEKQKLLFQQSLFELDALFASLQHRAFRGEL